ncbi:patatin-like phospholipase family protein [Pseudodesulfovibrio sediminis]|uniref:Serine protease n=1 Tax=Pseudodesulfovibrio sediminis TaxID=2810563 RepID=A0ABM7P4K6_9BACT|nr:patatin-like phospholipase family protein [Pseudodesulfovibrio sediminis]BCS87711.1 serine protease [Pseudodesulfovibrio sediminis]
MKKGKSISLVMGSGGARGLAHIGVIRWLEENGYEIKSISGCSMGALVGGIHAIGKLDEYEDWVRGITKRDMLALLDVSLGMDGLIKGDRIINTLRNLVGEERIENLPISFTAVAANISRRKEVWIRKGPLFDAIKASIALPLLFKPVVVNGEDIIDGGILNPVPIAPTFGDQTDCTIAVNLCAPSVKGGEIPSEKKNGGADNGSLVSKAITEFIGTMTDKITMKRHDFRAYTIVYKSFDAMQGAIARQKIAAYPPDCVLDIPINLCSLMDFDRAGPLIKHGYALAASRLPQFFESL